jgi:hypothetical protein
MALPKMPLFNMGRRDVAWAVMAFFVCSAVVLFIRSTQPVHPTGEHPGKALIVILGSVLAVLPPPFGFRCRVSVHSTFSGLALSC